MEWKIVFLVAMVTPLFPYAVIGKRCILHSFCVSKVAVINPSWTETQEICDDAALVRMNDTCYEDYFSCHQRCSTNYGAHASNKMSCYCDDKCLFYGDCCHDFERFCEEELEDFSGKFSHLPSPTTKCLNNVHTVIDSCRLDIDTKGKDEHLHSSDYVVTDGLTGLHFTNYTIFSCNREPGSRAIFWSKYIALDGKRQIVNPHPSSEIDIRVCSDTKMVCGEGCSLKGTGRVTKSLCVNAGNYLSKEKVNATQVTQRECVYEFVSEKDLTPFSVLARLSDSSDKGEIITPTGNIPQKWIDAECFDGVSLPNCQVRRCTIDTYRMGQMCHILRTINLTLEFNNAFERKLFNESKLLGLLNGTWGRLKNNFTTTLESSGADENLYQVIYVVTEWLYIKDDRDQLPVTSTILTELENVIEQDWRRPQITPTTARVCVQMDLNMQLQLEMILNPTKYMTFSESYSSKLVCDVITLFNSTSALDWVLHADYRNIEPFSDQAREMTSEGNLMKSRGGLFQGYVFSFVTFILYCDCRKISDL